MAALTNPRESNSVARTYPPAIGNIPGRIQGRHSIHKSGIYGRRNNAFVAITEVPYIPIQKCSTAFAIYAYHRRRLWDRYNYYGISYDSIMAVIAYLLSDQVRLPVS